MGKPVGLSPTAGTRRDLARSNWVGGYAPRLRLPAPGSAVPLQEIIWPGWRGWCVPNVHIRNGARLIRPERPVSQSGSGRTESPRMYPSVRICVVRG
jgi:hypothetical protein